jgi:hypothetical protein
VLVGAGRHRLYHHGPQLIVDLPVNTPIIKRLSRDLASLKVKVQDKTIEHFETEGFVKFYRPPISSRHL